MKKIILSVVITLSVISLNIPAGFAEDAADNEELFGTGLADMSDERWAELEAKLIDALEEDTILNVEF